MLSLNQCSSGAGSSVFVSGRCRCVVAPGKGQGGDVSSSTKCFSGSADSPFAVTDMCCLDSVYLNAVSSLC